MPPTSTPAAVSSEENGGVAHRSGWLLAIVVVGVLLRVYRLSWGLPDFIPPDSLNYYIRPAARLVAAGELVPPSFVHTPLFVYTIGLVDFVWSATVGEPIDLGPRPLRKGIGGLLPDGGRGMLGSQDFPPQLTTLILIARAFCVSTAALSIVVLYLFARRLIGVRAALLASAAFALSPLHVLESHRVNADGLMILFALLAAHRTVVATQKQNRRGLLTGFALAAVAAAVRYNGLAIATLPAWAAIRWPGAGAGARFRLLVAGSSIVAAVLAIGLLPAAFDWQRFQSSVVALFSVGFVAGGNLDLSGEGWVYHRYVYQFVATLPYSLGWPVYLCSLIGFPILARSHPAATATVLAAIVPFFLVQGAGLTVEHRYYQLLLPFLCVTAGVTLDALVARWKSLGIAAACAVLAYTAALTASHCLRLGLGPQRAVAELVHDRARAASAAGRTLGVGYPGSVDLLFDPVRTQIRDPTVRLHYLPQGVAGDAAGAGAKPISDEEIAKRLRQWVADKDVDVVLLPDWQEGVAERSSDPSKRSVARIYARLEDGSLGFRRAAHHRAGFLTESLYVWPDPLIETHRAVGVLGYKVFVKSEGDSGDR
jgi:hypothetical protein